MYDVEIYVIHWAVNKEAPFNFNFKGDVFFLEKAGFTKQALEEKVESISPDFIYCSGWMDKDYLSIAKKFRKKTPVVMGLDTQWRGSLKQHIASFASRFTLLKIFNYCWVPGEKQKKYALKLGFKPSQVLKDYYSADVDFFMNLGDKYLPEKKAHYPHKVIYAGRYYPFKGITDLWDAFIAWQNEQESDWELWCIGTGTEPPVQHPKIKHLGFVQPADFAPVIENGGIFILPSRYEPWGVVLHEFASAGFPLLASDAVGAGEKFITDGENGFSFKAGNVVEIKRALKKITSFSDKELLNMGSKSREKALSVTPQKWAETLMSIIAIK